MWCKKWNRKKWRKLRKINPEQQGWIEKNSYLIKVKLLYATWLENVSSYWSLHRLKVFQEKCTTLILLFTLEQALQIRKIHITRNTSLLYYATLYQQTCEMSYVFTLKDLYKPTDPLCWSHLGEVEGERAQRSPSKCWCHSYSFRCSLFNQLMELLFPSNGQV